MGGTLATTTQTCYRHPDRETAVQCSNCGRPICPQCMTPTPVGMRCPECTKQRTQVRTMRDISSPALQVTVALIIANAVLFVATGNFGVASSGAGGLEQRLALDAPDVAAGDWWRLVTGGFLHAGLLHVGFNMYLLYILGQLLEPALGKVRFGLVYFASLLAGSLGALIVTPDAYTVGASGAVFGLMGAGVLEMRARGIDPFAGGIFGSLGGLIVINLVFSFVVGGISIGGHIGGLVGGLLCALVLQQAERRRLPAWAGPVGVALVGAGCAVAAVLVARSFVGL